MACFLPLAAYTVGALDYSVRVRGNLLYADNNYAGWLKLNGVAGLPVITCYYDSHHPFTHLQSIFIPKPIQCVRGDF